MRCHSEPQAKNPDVTGILPLRQAQGQDDLDLCAE